MLTTGPPATRCHQKVLKKHRSDLLGHIKEWISSDGTYTVRFGIGMLMEHYLNEDFDPAYPDMAAGIRSDEYYVNMMIAWYFATALAKQYEAVLPYIENHRLDDWTHNKAIQKSVESNRISKERKEDYLRTLKTKKMKMKAMEKSLGFSNTIYGKTTCADNIFGLQL